MKKKFMLGALVGSAVTYVVMKFIAPVVKEKVAEIKAQAELEEAEGESDCNCDQK